VRLLAFETSTEACSVALVVGEEIREAFALAPQRHAELVLPMADRLLAEAGLVPADLDALAFARGPGSFTGVRIAAGVVQGIAFAADLPVAPVSTLAALALGAVRETGATRVAAALDARMGEIYWGTFKFAGGTVELLGEERVCAPEAVTALPGEWFGAGSGWSAHAAVLSRRLAVGDWQGDRYPRASDVARLAADPRRRGEWVVAERALPVYLRNEVVVKPAVASR